MLLFRRERQDDSVGKRFRIVIGYVSFFLQGFGVIDDVLLVHIPTAQRDGGGDFVVVVRLSVPSVPLEFDDLVKTSHRRPFQIYETFYVEMFEVFPVRNVLVDRLGNLYPVGRACDVISSGRHFTLPFHEIEKAGGEDFLDGFLKTPVPFIDGFRSAFRRRAIKFERNGFTVFRSSFFVYSRKQAFGYVYAPDEDVFYHVRSRC